MVLVKIMHSIEKPVLHTIVIQKSKFIAYLFPISEKKEIELYIHQIRQKEKDASHVCYAYRFDNLEKCTDDKEPSGTAGMPILNVIKQKDLHNVLCIVVRYFGGVKLGVGGLYRAYTCAIKEAILKSSIVSLIKGYKIQIIFSYVHMKDIDTILFNVDITQKDFKDNITYTFLISEEKYSCLKEKLLYYVDKLIVMDSLLLKDK